MRDHDQEHYPTASSNLHTQQFCGDTGSLKLWPVTVFGLSWWCVLVPFYWCPSRQQAPQHSISVMWKLTCTSPPALYSLLMAYTATIATVSKKYKWLAWEVCDQNFHQEAASNQAQPWPQKNWSIYSQCFLGMAKSAKGWCQTCQALGSSSDSWLAGSNTSTSRKWLASRQQGDSAYKPTACKPTCLKFNKNDRKCPFGARSRYVRLLTITKQLRHDCSATIIMNWPGTIGEATRIFKLVYMSDM